MLLAGDGYGHGVDGDEVDDDGDDSGDCYGHGDVNADAHPNDAI